MDTIPKQIPYIQSLDPDWYQPHVGNVSMLRLDVIHSVVSGNKWYKLKHNLAHALDEGYKSILTFGGGYSNHLVAAAAAAQAFGINSIGIVRGVHDNLTPTLKDCLHYGMQLVFLTKEEYAKKTDDAWLSELLQQYGNVFIVPEGGANEWGKTGVGEIAKYIPSEFTHVCVAVGTGTTFSGLRNALPDEQQLYGYVPMKGGRYLKEEISSYLTTREKNWQLFDDWHFGGFGKWNTELIESMNSFYRMNNIPLDIVYTGKMMNGISKQLQQGMFPKDARVLCIHTGGLQGNSSVQPQLQY